MENPVCNSCKKRISNSQGSTRFNCPNCGKYEIVRCRNCRETSAQYTCPGCDFTGPN